MAKHGMAWGIPSWRGNGDFVCVFLLFQELFVIGSIRSTPSLLVPNCEPSLWEYEIVPSGGLIIFIHTHKKGQRALAIARETHRRKFRSQTSDNLDRWKSRGGKSQRREEKRREGKGREEKRRKKKEERRKKRGERRKKKEERRKKKEERRKKKKERRKKKEERWKKIRQEKESEERRCRCAKK